MQQIGQVGAGELGLKVIVRHSKTDQEGAGQTIAIMRGSMACPVAALKAWLEAAGITAGPLFRSARKAAWWPGVSPPSPWPIS
jgi:hypothetical protein